MNKHCPSPTPPSDEHRDTHGAPPRRVFLRQGLRLGAAGALAGMAAAPARAAQGGGERRLAFAHTHTGEKLDIAYAAEGRFVKPALVQLNAFMRDHYSGEVGAMDPQLFELLYRLRERLGSQAPYEVISAYRSPATNALLRVSRAGGVAKRSLHMEGRAIDVRLPGVPLTALRLAALSLRGGGVGFYPREQFVHIDTGAPRSW